MEEERFEEALDALLSELIAPDPVTRSRASSEIGELFEANSRRPPTGEPRYYNRNVRPALRARTITDEETTRIVSFLRDLFLADAVEDGRHEGGRAWYLKAMEAAPPPLATETLVTLTRSAWDAFDAFAAMIASLALSMHLIAWRHTAMRSELVAALERSDALPWLVTVTEGTERRGTMWTVREMVASLSAPDEEPVPPGSRYRVQLGPDDGSREVVHVWAATRERAEEQATGWIAAIERDVAYRGFIRTEKIGDEPDASDLGIADRNDEVYWRRFDAVGRPRSTLLHVEIGDVERLTSAFRTDAAFGRVRGVLAAEGMDPSRVAAIAITPHPDPRNDPFLVIVVTADGSVRVWRGGPGWDEDGLVTLEEHWRRWRRVAMRYLEREEAEGLRP